MKIHPEGRSLLIRTGLILVGLHLLLMWLAPAIVTFTGIFSLLLFLFVLAFFRNPNRALSKPDDQLIYAPADGRIVVIEEHEEPEYFSGRRLMISIFMSLTDIHVNRIPVSGEVTYAKYHPGKYLVAWHPKSSTENERSTVVIRSGRVEVLIRQIAGALARRIITYPEMGDRVEQGKELGFIKFGSRVDVLLPLDATPEVEPGQRVRGNETILARIHPAPSTTPSTRSDAMKKLN